MKINVKAVFMVVGKSKTYSEKSKKDYYSIAVVNQSGEAGNLSCSEDCYNTVTDLFKNYNFALTYNDQYNFMQATGAQLIKQ